MKPDPKTQADVKAVVDAWFKGYCKRDAAAIMDVLGSDADCVFIGSGADERRIGPHDLKVALEQDFSAPKALTIQVPWLSISVSGNVAWVAADCICETDTKDRKVTVAARQTMVLEKRGTEWLVVQSHFSLPSGGPVKTKGK